MANGCILIADNNADYRTVCAKFLRAAGYQVCQADGPDQARHMVQTTHIHLAVLDLRMVNDDDSKDQSGLALARELPRSLPKIILTAFPTYQDVREALKLDADRLPAAIDFVDKKQGGLEALREAIEQAFEQHVCINWDLLISSSSSGSQPFLPFASRLAQGATNDTLVNLAGELEDLVRRLFYDYQQIRLGDPFWQDPRRICLPVMAQTALGATDHRILSLGDRALLGLEAERMLELAPDTTRKTEMLGTAETTHFGACLYLLQGADGETPQPLSNWFHSDQDTFVKTALGDLLWNTLPAWHQHGDTVIQETDLMALYRSWAGLEESQAAQARVRAQVHALVQAVLPLEAMHIELGQGSIAFHLPRMEPLICPDPVATAYAPLARFPASIVCKVSPGRLSPANVLVDSDHRTWLTDLSYAGQAPQWWDYVCLEAAIRFDLAQASDLMAWCQFEDCLVETLPLREHLRIPNVGGGLQSMVLYIEQIRRRASTETGDDPRPYFAGLLIWAVNEIAQYKSIELLMPAERLRAAHLLLGAAMLAWRLGEVVPHSSNPGALRLDQDGTVLRGKRLVAELSGNKLDLLRAFFAAHNHILSRREIVNRIFHETYREDDANQQTRVNTLIGRLRRAIEPTQQPQYIVLVRGHGYRLWPDGKQKT